MAEIRRSRGHSRFCRHFRAAVSIPRSATHMWTFSACRIFRWAAEESCSRSRGGPCAGGAKTKGFDRTRSREGSYRQGGPAGINLNAVGIPEFHGRCPRHRAWKLRLPSPRHTFETGWRPAAGPSGLHRGRFRCYGTIFAPTTSRVFFCRGRMNGSIATAARAGEPG